MTLTKKKNDVKHEEFDLDKFLEYLRKIEYGNFHENAGVAAAYKELKRISLKFPYSIKVLLRDGRALENALKRRGECIYDGPDGTYCFVHHCGAYDEQCGKEDCPHC